MTCAGSSPGQPLKVHSHEKEVVTGPNLASGAGGYDCVSVVKKHK